METLIIVSLFGVFAVIMYIIATRTDKKHSH